METASLRSRKAHDQSTRGTGKDMQLGVCVERVPVDGLASNVVGDAIAIEIAPPLHTGAKP